MRLKAHIIVLGTLMVAAFFAAVALPSSPAGATPGENSRCSSCHISDSQVSASVTQASATSWNVTITGPYSGRSGFGVFNAAGSKVASGLVGSGTFTIPNPSGTYTFYGVDKTPSSMQGYRSVVFSAAAATPTSTPVPATPTAAPSSTPVPTAAATSTPAGPTATPTPVPAPPSGESGPGAVIGTKHDLGSPGSAACAKCHTPHDAAGKYLWSRPVGGGTGIQPLCYSCHDGSVTSVGKYAFDASLSQHATTSGVKGADCDRCHNPHVGTFKFTTQTQLNADLCTTCHGKSGPDNHPVDVLDSITLPIDRVWNPNASPADFSGTRLYDSTGTTQVLAGAGYVKCLTCHSAHGGAGGTKLNTMATSSATNSTAPLCQNCHK